MRKSHLDLIDQRNQREATEFFKRWDWERVLYSWRKRLADFSVVPNPIFREIVVHDPANPIGRESDLTWWPVKDIEKLRAEHLDHLERFPGTIGPIEPYEMRQGERDTLRHLWKVRDDSEKVAAILISASLFSRYESSRKARQDNWPPYYVAETLMKWAYAAWSTESRFGGWHYACTGVIPFESSDYVYMIDSADALVRYLAEEHAALLLQYSPVVIRYEPDLKPNLRSV